MKKTIKAICMLFLILTVAFSGMNTLPVFAASDNHKQEISRVEAALDALNHEYGPDIIITTNPELFDDSFAELIRNFSDYELYMYLKQYYKKTFSNLKVIYESNSSFDSKQVYGTRDWIEYRTVSSEATVSSAIPSIGVCSIHIPFVAQMKKLSTNNLWYFDSVTVGTSYQTGLALATWSHISGSATIGGYGTYASLLVSGILAYGIPKTPLIYQSYESFTCNVNSSDLIS